MKMLRPLVVVALLSMLGSAAQTVKNFELKDQSPPDCPIRISAEIQFTEIVEDGKFKASYTEHFVTFNATDKAIVALVVVNHVANSYGPLVDESRLLDAFFAHDLEIPPMEKHAHDHPTESGLFVENFRPNAKLGTPHAEGKVIFVQFADSSIWGDINDSRVQSLMSTRELILQTINRLDEAASKGDDEFLKALAINSGNGDVDQTVLGHLRDFQKNRGNRYAKGMVKQMLAIAASR